MTALLVRLMTKLLLRIRFCQGLGMLRADFRCGVDAWEDSEQERL